MSSLVQPSEMVEVRVEIQGHGVYMPGERLTAAVSFTNEGALAATVAWAGAQLHCQLVCREGVVKVDLDSLNPASPGTDTTFIPNRGERGHTILSTSTTVLFCNLSLQPGETKTVMYSEQVPLGGPPSFSGRLVKYTYKLAVGAQKPGCAAQITRIPFHVMTIPETLYKKNIVPSPKTTNPFLTSEVQEDPMPDIALQALAMETSKRTSMNYTLKNPSGIIGRISLFKPSYKLGEDVTGAFDLSMATVPCVQFAAELHSIEEVPEKLLVSGHAHKPVHSTHARYSECCHNVLQTHFSLPVPLSATQTFNTSCVTVKWQIHFEFIINRSQPKKNPTHSENSVPTGSAKPTLLQLLSHAAMDTMTWDLPIVILPTLPSQSDERTITHSITI